LLSQKFWLEHNLGKGGWQIAREHREIPDLSAYPEIVRVAEVVPATRKQLWVSCLRAGASIRPHNDSERAGAVRIHVPLVGAGTLLIEEQTYRMRVGEYWAVDTVGRQHSAHNDGPIDRIHLLVDVLPSPWLRDHVPWL